DRGLVRGPRLAAADRGAAPGPPMAARPAAGVPSLGRAPRRSSRAALARGGAWLMPEWPDLHVVRGRLEKALVGREITLVRVGDPTVLRATKPIETALAHRRFTGVRHRGKFRIFDLDRGRIVVNPMLAGVFELTDAEAKLARSTALSLVMDDGTDLRYRDDKRMGKVHIVALDDDLRDVHGVADLGPDAGDFTWSQREFAERARASRRELRNLLQDQTFLAGIGNAYADEILWEAKLHPKRRVVTLNDEAMSHLSRSLTAVHSRAT